MHRSSWLSILLALAVVVTPLVASVALLPKTASAEVAAPDATADDEIVLLTSTGQIRVDDPVTPSGVKPVAWNSGSDTGWTKVAAGDFNKDGDAEIVAAKSNIFKVFDPVVQFGSQTAAYELNLGTSRTIQLLATGDFDGDLKDEIALTVYDAPAGAWVLRIYDGGATATASEWVLWYSADFGATWQDMSVGDFDDDGYDDLVLVRNADRRVSVYKGGPSGLSTLAGQSGYATNWLAVAAGDITATYAGDEIALERDSANALTNALILLRVSGSALSDIGAGVNYKYNPDFASVALGDLNGDADDEIVMLRDPIVNKIALLVVNPAGNDMRDFAQTIGFGTAAWKLVRAGDVDGDTLDEIVVLRGNEYRIYGAPASNDNYTPTTGNFYVTSTTSNTPTMAVANVDGAGQTLGPTLYVSPAALTFNLEYSQISPTQTVAISNTGTSAQIAWGAEVTSGASWLRIDQTSGVTPGSLGVSVDTSAITPGTYTGTVRVSATTAGVGGTPQDVTVSLTLTGVALSVTPTSMSFNVEYGEPSPVQVVSIRSVGGSAAFGWKAEILQGQSWLVLSALQGTTPTDLGVSVNSAAAGPGTHTGTIHVYTEDGQVANPDQYVTVRLTVPDPGFVVMPSALTIWQKTGAPVVTRNVTIWRPGGTVSWSAAALPAQSLDAVAEKLAAGEAVIAAEGLLVDGNQVEAVDWLVFAPASGVTTPDQPSIMTVNIKPGTPIGKYSAVIVVVASSANPGVTDPVQYISVSAVVTDDIYKSYLPFAKR